MEIKKIDYDFSVCKVQDYSLVDLDAEYSFVGKTDEENSLVCITENVPQNVIERDDGWKAFRIQGVLDFSLIGILSKISGILAANEIGIFAISTFNTDYVLTKKENYRKALDALADAGYTIVESSKFDKIISFIEPLKSDSVGEWLDGTEDIKKSGDVLEITCPKYSKTVCDFIDAIYEFNNENPKYNLTNYSELLNERGIDGDIRSLEEADVSGMDAQGIMALLMGMVRLERFCDGTIMNLIKSGAVSKWLLRLKEICEDD